MPSPPHTPPLSNRAFRYGDGVFASLPVRKGNPEHLSLHLARLEKGCRILKMEYPAAALQKELDALLSTLNPEQDWRLRIELFRNGGGLYLPLQNDAGILCEAEALEAPVTKALRLGIYSEMRLGFNLLSGIKHCNRLVQVLAAQYAKEKGFDEVLLPGTSGMAEGSASNLFVVDKGILITPPVETGCYPGTTRERILEFARKKGIPAKEEVLELADISNAQEIFVCNAIGGIRPVGWFRDLEYAEGALTKRLQEMD